VVVCRQLLQEVHKSYPQGDMGNCQWHIPAWLSPSSRCHSYNHVSSHWFFLAAKNRNFASVSSNILKKWTSVHSAVEDMFRWLKQSLTHRHIVKCASKCISLCRRTSNDGTNTKVRYLYFTPMIY
jgi:hypothetical protein